jgi:ligand-binding SRPBCC domain-containing protein
MPQLHYTQFIPADPAAVWEFFATPCKLDGLRILGPVPERMYAGQLIAYRISPGLGLWLRWLTEIRHVREGVYFVDEQRAGPYRFWYHEHQFEAVPGGVLMTDRITYEIGWGPVGWLADRWWVRRQLRRIFAFRQRRVEEIFGRP